MRSVDDCTRLTDEIRECQQWLDGVRHQVRTHIEAGRMPCRGDLNDILPRLQPRYGAGLSL